jgi:hypothetical protein
MLIISPREVAFGGAVWTGIAAAVVDRSAAQTIEEFGENGPYAAFADVPRQRVRVRIVQDVVGEEGHTAPGPGQEAVLSITMAQAGRPRSRRLSTKAVILAVEHEVSLKRGSVRTITLAAVSIDGAADPITIESL